MVVTTAKDNGFVWGLHDQTKNFSRSASVELRQDGTFAVYDANGASLWAPPLKGRDPNAKLTLSFSGALQVVSDQQGILWSSDGILTPSLVVTGKPNGNACKPEPGWSKCFEMADPKITIYGTARASQSAMNAVANIYAEMTNRFKAQYSKNKFDGFKVYLTNGEPWSVLEKIEPVGSMWPNKTGPTSGNELRGGASRDFLWISEQMICKQGVKTRNDDFKVGKAPTEDKALRTYDQVIHEFTHSIDFQFNLGKRVATVFRGKPRPEEAFPQAVQSWFGAPTINNTPAEKAFVSEIFSSQTSFSCDTYRP